MPRLVANILSHNELHYLENLIPQVANMVDRIVVVDDESTDGTLNYLASWPMVEVIHRKFDLNFSNQRNTALERVNDGDWVWRIDADEIPTSKMRHIKSVIAHLDAIGIDRLQVPIYHLINFVMCKQEIGVEIRLFKKNPTCSYQGNIHERITATFPGLLHRLPEDFGLVHLKYMDTNKVHQLQTEYISKGLYKKDDVDRRLHLDAAFLPSSISFHCSEDLESYLCTPSI